MGNYQDKFNEAKKLYKSFVSLPCKAFNNEKIIFNRKGFDHLVRKNRKVRPITDQTRRFGLLKYIPMVMSNGQIHGERHLIRIGRKHVNGRTEEKKIYTSQWKLLLNAEGFWIEVIIEQEGNGKKHFLSIYPSEAKNHR